MDDHAALHLQQELAAINFKFLRGELRAFGTNQDEVLAELERIQIHQVELSMQQVSLMGELYRNQATMMPSNNEFLEIARSAQFIGEKEEKLSTLYDELQSLCANMSHLFKKTTESTETFSSKPTEDDTEHQFSSDEDIQME